MVEAYVFISSVTKDALARLGALTKRETSGVRYVTSLTGEFDAFAAIQAETLPALEKIVTTKIRGRGVGGTQTYIVVIPVPPIVGPKWAPPSAVEVFTRCKVEAGHASKVISALMKLPNAMGAAGVAGDFDVLFEAGADTFEKLLPTLVGLHGIKGMRSSSSSFSSGPHHYSPRHKSPRARK